MKVIDFTVSDDIRQEIGEKHTLVGVLPYDVNITVKPIIGEKIQWPIVLKYGVFIRASLNDNEGKPTNFKLIKLLNDKELDQIEGKLDINTSIKYINMALSLQFNIPESGVLRFKVQFFEKDKKIHEFIPEYNIKIIV